MPLRQSPLDASERVHACVLVVDDYADERAIVRETLEDEGYTVMEACDGREALARVLHGPHPDLVLLDLLMPSMDGWQFVAELRAHPDLADIPVVVATGGGLHILTSAPVSAGYLVKPLDRTRLLETVAATLERSRHKKKSGQYPASG